MNEQLHVIYEVSYWTKTLIYKKTLIYWTLNDYMNSYSSPSNPKWTNSYDIWSHKLNKIIDLLYPAIPLYRLSTCFFFLFLEDGKHNSLPFPIFNPRIERTSLLNSSSIACIFLSTSATNLAAAWFSQAKSWFRMWLMESFNFCVL